MSKQRDEWAADIERCLDLLRGSEIEEAEAVIPIIGGRPYDRMDAIRIKVKGGPWLRIDHWGDDGDNGMEIEEEAHRPENPS